jgi:hypothetical protein
MIIFHPEVHVEPYITQKDILKKRAENKEIFLLLECKQYEPNSLEYVNGFECMNNYPYVSLCTLYQLTRDVHYDTLKDGGKYSLPVLVHFMLCVLIFKSNVEMEIEKYQDEEWYESFEHFIRDIQFDITDYNNIHEHLQQHVRERAKLYGGLPSRIPYRFIQIIVNTIFETKFRNQNINDIIIQYTLIEREYEMSKHILHFYEKYSHTNENIHICIGAGHLMPFLTEKNIDSMGLDDFFKQYHHNIQQPRLLHHLKNVSYEIHV